MLTCPTLPLLRETANDSLPAQRPSTGASYGAGRGLVVTGPAGHAAERLHLPGARDLSSDLHGEPAVLQSPGEHSAGGPDDALQLPLPGRPGQPGVPGAPPRVSYRRSVELVLASAREYFNSSTALTDNCMTLARSCLQLISDCPPDIQEELDLINALSQLEEFGVKILPLQVRLREDRLS
ncbi:hypothetical protein ANANG_G00115920 [Anguilla anguilla]|uniref:Uncharacterized protein n=1 Tax=Anguilla anguilla TaxID=7936 RepID=A0A9D3RX86_ANGAN|nr:hypothetical protein ANANG_G00115920 [Anguilla anguilla]